MNLLAMLEAASYTSKRRKAQASPVRDRIMQYIADNPRCTMAEIQKATYTTDRSIASWMHRLHKGGMICREEFSTTHFGGRPRFVFWSNQDGNKLSSAKGMASQ